MRLHKRGEGHRGAVLAAAVLGTALSALGSPLLSSQSRLYQPPRPPPIWSSPPTGRPNNAAVTASVYRRPMAPVRVPGIS